MSPGFQYDAPLGVRMSDQNFLRAELLFQARRADHAGKHMLAAEMRKDAKSKGGYLLKAALGASYAVRS